MRAVRLSTFLHYIADGAFNPDHLAPHCCSQTTAILIAFLPSRHLLDIENVGIGCVIRRSGAPMGDTSSIRTVLESIWSVLKSEADKQCPHHRAYMMLIANYGGHMAFTTEPPYCVAYAVEYRDKDPSKMMSRKPENHWYVMVSEKMIVRRLLSVLNWEPSEKKRINTGPLIDSAMGHDAPLQTVGSF